MLSRMRGRISVVVLLALALAGCSGPAQSDAPAPGDFVRHPNAVQPARVDDTLGPAGGISQLVPVGKCAIGIGSYANGHDAIGTNWNGSADCTSFQLPATAGHVGLAANSAVALADGSVIGANRVLQRLGPDGVVTGLADLHLPTGNPTGSTDNPGLATAIVRSGGRLVIGGGQLVNDSYSPLMWTSADGGKTVTPVQLPQVNGYVGPMAASGDTIVAAERSADNGRLGIWRSVDSGQHWQLTEFAAGPAKPIATSIVRTEHGWLLVGSGQDDLAHSFLATSPDGVAWKVIDTSALGAGRIVDATGTRSGEVVLVGVTLSSDGGSYCGVVWTGATDSLRRVDLGCDDEPKATTALADGRVIVVGARTVWVRA
jgi:hypothetical protein